MTLQETLRKIGKKLQHAVVGRQFSQADALVREYRRCLDAVPPDAPDREAILRDSTVLFEEVRRMALAARSVVATRLRALPKCAPAHYGEVETRRRSTWELQG